jgi:hypothetical protein
VWCIKNTVPNQRSSNQVLLSFWLDSDLASALDQARGTQGRSQYIRDTLAQKLKASGIELREDVSAPPDRVKNIITKAKKGGYAVGVQHNTFTSAQGGRGAHARYKASKKKKKG